MFCDEMSQLHPIHILYCSLCSSRSPSFPPLSLLLSLPFTIPSHLLPPLLLSLPFSISRSLPPSLPSSFTPFFLHSLPPSLPLSFTPSLLHSLLPSLPPSFTPSLLYSLSPSLYTHYPNHQHSVMQTILHHLSVEAAVEVSSLATAGQFHSVFGF